MSKSCATTENGHLRQFSCSLSQHCCGAECCDSDLRFYTHWYFWLAVSVLVLFLIGAIISAYSKHRYCPAYCVLHSDPEKGSCQSSPKKCQLVHTAHPYMFDYKQLETSARSQN